MSQIKYANNMKYLYVYIKKNSWTKKIIRQIFLRKIKAARVGAGKMA